MDSRLKRDPGSQLHHQLSSVLQSSIVSGHYGHGAFLPGETALMALFGVSRATVRRALLTLEIGGLIERQQGRGTRVLWKRPVARETMEEHRRQIDRNARNTTVRVLQFELVRAPSEIMTALHLPDDTAALRIVRVRRRGDQPLWYLVNYLPPAMAALLTRRKLQRATLIATLGDVGHAVHRAEDEVGAALADPVVADVLGVRIGAPLIELTRMMFDAEGRPLAYQLTLFPPDRHKLRIVIQGNEQMPIGAAAEPGILTRIASPRAAEPRIAKRRHPL